MDWGVLRVVIAAIVWAFVILFAAYYWGFLAMLPVAVIASLALIVYTWVETSTWKQ